MAKMGTALFPLFATLKLRFADNEEERAFYQRFYSDQRIATNVFILIGAFLYYVFFIWDDIIDGSHSGYTHAIRGIITVIILGCYVVIRNQQNAEKSELILTILYGLVAETLILIYSILHDGFRYGAVGIVLVIMFFSCAVPIRFGPQFQLSLLATVSLAAATLYSGLGIGFTIVNSLSGGAAMLLGITAVYYREADARKKFVLSSQLHSINRKYEDIKSAQELLLDRFGDQKKIFISYRRDDCGAIAGRIRDRLAAYFGEGSIFFDIDNVPFGVDFRDHIKSCIHSCDIFIALIGAKWRGEAQGAYGILEPRDPIRVEIEEALISQRRIIPVLIDNAHMPNADTLPEPMRALVDRNAGEISSGRNFNVDMDRVIRAIVAN